MVEPPHPEVKSAAKTAGSIAATKSERTRIPTTFPSHQLLTRLANVPCSTLRSWVQRMWSCGVGYERCASPGVARRGCDFWRASSYPAVDLPAKCRIV
jgi:hypothetical protein